VWLPFRLAGPEGTRITRPDNFEAHEFTVSCERYATVGISRVLLIRELGRQSLSGAPLFPPDHITGYADQIDLFDLCAIVVIECLCDQWALLSANVANYN